MRDVHKANTMTCRLTEDYFRGSRLCEYVKAYGVEYVLDEYLKSETEFQDWSPIIDSNMYEKALSEFLNYGMFMRFPARYIYSWVGIVMRNTAILLSDTILFGRGRYLPFAECEKFLEKSGIEYESRGIWDDCFTKIGETGLYRWMRMPDESIAVTDFGISQIANILSGYNEYTPPEQAFTLVNLCLNAVHLRGDISSVFIKGGRSTLDRLR